MMRKHRAFFEIHNSQFIIHNYRLRAGRFFDYAYGSAQNDSVGAWDYSKR